jgi:hypothetical protein
MTTESMAGIPIVYVDGPAVGEKGLFGAAGHVVVRSAVVDSGELADNLSAVCGRLTDAFQRADDGTRAFELDTVEVTLDLTAKGQVRMIASVSSEIRGGLKLVFRRRAGQPPR